VPDNSSLFRSRPLGLVPATELLWPLSPTVLWGLRMILIDIASLVTAPKEARPQALFSFLTKKTEISISVDLLLNISFVSNSTTGYLLTHQ